MKKIIALIALTVFIISCGEKKKEQTLEDVLASNNLEVVRAKKKELDSEQKDLTARIKKLEGKISILDTNKKIPLITIDTIVEENFVHYLEFQGNVQTKQNVLIYPEMGGQLQAVYVKEGQRVSKGQLLAKIDDGGMTNQLAQAETAADLAKITFERQKRLWDRNIGSEIQYLQAKANYESQQNGVLRLKKTLGKFNVTAPFSGVIDNVIKEQGTIVGPGQGAEIFRIVNLSKMYIETDVPEGYITSITRGKKVEVEFPVLQKTISSKVRQAGNFINPANRTFKVEVSVENRDRSIKPNLTAKLKINDYTNPKAILIPQSVISENAEGNQYVYLIEKSDDGKFVANQTFIKTGRTKGDLIEVIEGLINDKQIVIEGSRTINDNQEVRISSNEESK